MYFLKNENHKLNSGCHSTALYLITSSFHSYVCSSRNIHIFHSFHGYDEFNKLAFSHRMGLIIAQSVEHCSANAEALGFESR